jgi:4-hydroxybenzoate polyprenyltransferase
MREKKVIGNQTAPLLTATRPVNQLISMIAVLAGWIISTDTIIPEPEIGLFLLMISAFCASGGVNLINDVSDLKIDRRSHPERAVASGYLSPTAARNIAFSLLILALITAAASSFIYGAPLPIIIFTLVLILDLIYELWIKRMGMIGNVVVSIIVGLSFPFGASVHGINATIWIIFSVAFMANGDRGSRITLPMSIGEKRTLVLSSFILLAAILAGLTILLLRNPNQLFTIMLTCVNLILLSAIWTTYKNTSKAQTLIKIGMALAVFSFIILPL